jgi:hypothetical protein
MSQDETSEKAPGEQPAMKPQRKQPRNQLLVLAVLIAVVGLVGALVWDLTLQKEAIKATGQFKGTQHNAVLGITIFTQAMIAFFGILNLDEPHTTKVSPLTKGGMRSAITGAFVVTYLFLLIFHTMVEFTTGRSPITDSFVNSFTTIVGVTIFFYFASEAAIHWINVTKPKL